MPAAKLQAKSRNINLHVQGSLHHRAGASAGDDGPANVLIKYIVPPPVQQEFIEIFQAVKEGKCSVSCTTVRSFKQT